MVRKALFVLLVISVLFSCKYTTKADDKKLVVCITFDDNYPNVYENALPEMNKYGFRATTFINCGNVSNPFYMHWDKLDELYHLYKWEIGGHTLNHNNLFHLSYTQAEYVIKSDYDSLVAHGYNPVSFATSFGICPLEYHPIITKYYKNLRIVSDNPMYTPINRAYIGCFYVTIRTSPRLVESRIRQAIIEKESLVVLLFHRIAEGLTMDSNYEPDKFAELMQRLAKLDVKVLPLNEALDYLEDTD